MKVELITPPAREPISVDEVRDQARISGTELDNQIQRIIGASRDTAERFLNRAIITQTWKLYLDVFSDEMMLFYPPLQSVSQVQYVDTDSNTQVLDSGEYTVDTVVEPGIVRLGYEKTWPDILDYPNSVIITYVAGYGDGPEDVPEPIRHAMMAHCVMMLDNPSPLDYGSQVRMVPQVFERLLADHRIFT